MNRISKKAVGAVALAAIMVCGANAADQTKATTTLSAISTYSVEASAAQSKAALNKDAEKAAAYQVRVDMLASLKEQAEALNVKLGEAKDGSAAAKKIESQLDALLEQASKVAKGEVTDELAEEVRQMRIAAGATTFDIDSYDPPNMYEQPWTSSTMNALYQEHYANLFTAGRTTGDVSKGDGTPE